MIHPRRRRFRQTQEEQTQHIVRTPPTNKRECDAVIVVCSGPSLDMDAVTDAAVEEDADVCAISTALRVVMTPDYWVFLDRPNRKHGERIAVALPDPTITKVTQSKRYAALCGYPAMVFIPQNRRTADEGRTFMDGKPGYIRGPNRSILHAVQFLCYEGYKRLIFAGVDLTTTLEQPYCHDLKIEKRSLELQNDGHRNTLEYLRQWTPIAAERGIRFISMTPNSPINEFMEVL